MRAAIIALMLMFGSQAGAECGNLCKSSWWDTATTGGVQAELDSGADVNGGPSPDAEALAFEDKFKKLFWGSAYDETGKTPLHYAATVGTPQSIQLLLTAGANITARNYGGHTPLHSAAQSGTPENIQALLAAGSDVTARGKTGDTPLHKAAAFSGPFNEEALLVAKADRTANGLANIQVLRKRCFICQSSTGVTV